MTLIKTPRSFGKRLLAMALAVAMLLTYLPGKAATHVHAETLEVLGEGTCGTNVNWVLYATGELVISGTGKMNDFRSTSSPWYSNRTKVTSVEISDGITHIGNYSFNGCTNLSTISIPESVTTIGSNAFYNCKALPNITLPSQLTSISDSMFYNCTALQSIVIPNSVISIGNSAFQNCGALTSVAMSNSVTSIGTSAFSSCKVLEKNTYDKALYLGNAENPYLVLLETVSTSGITSFEIHPNTRVIAPYTFDGRSAVKSFVIPDSVVSIGYGAFDGCSGMEYIVIGSGVIRIDNYAFRDCSKLNHVLYRGTEQQWKNITVSTASYNHNAILFADTVTRHFNAVGDEIQDGSCGLCCQHTYDHGCDTDCNLCGATRTVADHVYSNKCDTDCNECGATREVQGHISNAQFPCQDGVCSNCGIDMPATELHQYDNDCDATCNTCSDVRVPEAHNLKKTDAKDATCLASGHAAYWQCDVCKVYFADEAGTSVIENIATWLAEGGEGYAAKLDHDFNGVGGRCLNGCNKKECQYTGEHEPVYVIGDTPKTHHKVCILCEGMLEESIPCSDSDTDTDHTCDYCEGTAALNVCVYSNNCDTDCNICDATRTVADHVYNNKCDKDCNECGYTRQVGDHTSDAPFPCQDGNCIDCGTPIPGVAHSYTEQITVKPDCENEGTKTFTCDCGDSYTEKVDALGHDLAHTDAKVPSCAEPGNVEYWTCGNCSKHFADEEGITELAEDELVVKADHSIVEVEATAPSSAAAGNQAHFKCSQCGNLYWDAEGSNPATDKDVTLNKLGDADGDGNVDAFDASLIQRYSAGMITENDFDFTVCDLDGDGYVDAYDASLILRFSVGILSSFPVENK